jgi:DNA-binding NarL/FixJ family response regulator
MKALKGEWLGLRALALAASGSSDEGAAAAVAATQATTEIQARTLSALAHAIISIHTHDSSSDDTLEAAVALLTHSQDYDNFVCAYRAYPPLLTAILETAPQHQRLIGDIVSRAGDAKLARVAGWNLDGERPSPLSSREREVFGLICDGLTNREIAQMLFISEATVKVHIRHIFDKLNVRSRTQAVLRLQDA